jgi:uncharacterized protein DUF4412
MAQLSETQPITNFMKRFYSIFALVVVLSSRLLAQSSFEGVINMTTSIPMLGISQLPVTVSAKGDRLKMVTDLMAMGEVTIYVDKPAGRIVAIMPAMNTGYEMDMKKLESNTIGDITTEAAPTGAKETINNYQCTEFSCMLKDNVEMKIWMTKDMPNTMHKAILNSFSGTLSSLQINISPFTKLMDNGYAPIRTVIKKSGAEQLALTLDKYEAKKVDDDTFIVPANIPLEKK